MARILCVTSLYPPHHLGGYEVSCRDVMERLAGRGHDVTVLTADHRNRGVADPPDERAANPAIRRDLQLYVSFAEDGHHLVDPPLHKRWRIERENQRALTEAIDDSRPDVAAVWHVGALSLGLITTLRQRGIPIVYGVSDDWTAYAAELDQWLRHLRPLGRAARALRVLARVPTRPPDLAPSGTFLFISDCTRRRADVYGARPLVDTSVVYSGIDRTFFATRPGDVDRTLSAWQWRLLYVGRFDARKGLETLVRAMPHLPPEATLEVQGTGDDTERERLAAIADELDVGDRIRWERVGRDELVDRYRAADVVVFPSEWEEPFGLVPLEAMAVGTPVVATGAGGSGEFLLDDVNCVRFAAGDPASLATAVERVAGDVELRTRLVAAGVKTADWFDVEHLTDAYEAWHTAAAAGFASGRPARRTFTAAAIGAPEPATVVRIGVVSWNTADLLDRCLAAIPAAITPYRAEVVVVDNDSHDGSADVAAGHAVDVIRNERNVGYARAMNQALDSSEADVLIALNPDTAPAPGSLAALVRTLDDRPEVGLVVPRLTYPNGALQHSVYRFPSIRLAAVVCFVPRRLLRGTIGRRWWLEGFAPHDESAEIDWAIGAVHVVRTDALAGSLPYSERWFMYVEDLEICWRMHQSGWKVWLAADVEVIHVSNAAGAQAWGDTRSQRFWAATYDWVGQAQGRRQARRWAAVNTAGAGMLYALNRLGAALPGTRSGRRRAAAHALRTTLPIHARAFVGGPPPPEPPPESVA